MPAFRVKLLENRFKLEPPSVTVEEPKLMVWAVVPVEVKLSQVKLKFPVLKVPPLNSM